MNTRPEKRPFGVHGTGRTAHVVWRRSRPACYGGGYAGIGAVYRAATSTHSYGVTHPSQPNYLTLFSGSTHGVRSNACPKHFRKADNLGHQLRKAGLSFIGYAESLPKTGFRGASRAATSASTTRGSTSPLCPQAQTGLPQLVPRRPARLVGERAPARLEWFGRVRGKDGKQRWIRAVDLRPANGSQP